MLSDWLSECLYLQRGRYFLIGCCEHYGSLWKPTYKRGHSVAVNTAWFSSRLHVEAWRQPGPAVNWGCYGYVLVTAQLSACYTLFSAATW